MGFPHLDAFQDLQFPRVFFPHRFDHPFISFRVKGNGIIVVGIKIHMFRNADPFQTFLHGAAAHLIHIRNRIAGKIE